LNVERTIPGRRAFTLIELIVVIILMAVTAGIVIPRAFNGGAKRAEQTAKSIASLLTAVAQRDATAFEPMMIAYDREDGTVEAQVIREVKGERRWSTDLFIDAVVLDSAVIRSAEVDGYPLDDKRWSIEIPVSTPRPLIEIVVALDDGERDGRAWRVVLEPGASAARVTDAGVVENRDDPERQKSVDLDALGMGESPW